MTKRARKWIIYGLLLIATGWALYQRSDYGKLRLTDEIYRELEHPAWSKRIHRNMWTTPSGGSGDHRMLYLVDVRAISPPLVEAVAYYENETDRLGFRECHVDGYSTGTASYSDELGRYGLEGESEEDIVVILQAFTSNSSIRRHEPVQQGGGTKGN